MLTIQEDPRDCGKVHAVAGMEPLPFFRGSCQGKESGPGPQPHGTIHIHSHIRYGTATLWKGQADPGGFRVQ